jgi:hypothetical protein
VDAAVTSPVAEEAAKLLEALQSWASGAHGWPRAAGQGLPLASDAPECTVCPLCQVLRAVRGVRPEVLDHLAGATTELVAALRAALENPAGEPAARTVEKIEVAD